MHRQHYEPTVQAQCLQIAAQVLAADNVEDHVDPDAVGVRADRRYEVLAPVVDRQLGTERYSLARTFPASLLW